VEVSHCCSVYQMMDKQDRGCVISNKKANVAVTSCVYKKKIVGVTFESFVLVDLVFFKIQIKFTIG
jgi:hypothetical protein